nr:VCBS repeat-containing protein [Pirellulales bacterium]
RDLDLIFGMEGPERHEIYLQGPANQFTPVGAAVGFQVDFGTKGYGMAMGDADDDGDVDIYISTCRFGGNIRNNFFKNMLAETGTLGFVDVADANGTQYLDNSYGAEFWDFDDDRDLDLLVTGADAKPTKIFRNDGGAMFTDVDTITGHPLLSDTGSDLNGSRAVDYDNDGDLDLFFHDNLATVKNSARKLYRNDGNWQFTDVTVAEGIHESNRGAYDSTWGDLDLDGDQDLIATTGSSTVAERFFISNASTNGNHWLYLRLAGPTDNTTAIGASIYATINAGTPEEKTLRREANTNAGTFNQSDLPVHFGLGLADHIDELSIHWPDGTIQTIFDVTANQYLTVNTPGDFNGDGQVDSADLAQWQGDFGVNALSDANLDGLSDGADFLWWQRQLGNGVPAATATSATVPEPGAAILVLLAAAAGPAAIRASENRRLG